MISFSDEINTIEDISHLLDMISSSVKVDTIEERLHSLDILDTTHCNI